MLQIEGKDAARKASEAHQYKSPLAEQRRPRIGAQAQGASQVLVQGLLQAELAGPLTLQALQQWVKPTGP